MTKAKTTEEIVDLWDSQTGNPPIGGIKMSIEDEIQWIVTESIRKGVYDTYKQVKDSMPSCKPYMFEAGHIYDDCMLEKANYSLEYALSEV